MEMKYLLEMTDVEVIPLNTNQSPPHKGIQIWGWGAKSNLKRVTVTYGECGLMYYPMYNYEESKVQQNVRSYTHTVDNCNFESNRIGIEAIRVPVWVKDSYFNNYNDKGIHTSGTLGATYFVNNIFSGNYPNYKTVGISYTGANRLFLKRNTLYNNHIAIHTNRALVSAGCNEILNNSDAIRLEDHADLYMSTKSIMSGFNNLYGNSTSILSRYNGSVYLSEGFNIMKSQPDDLRKQLSFFINGDISKTMPNNTLDILSNYVEPEPEYILSDQQWNMQDWTEGNSHPPFNTFLYNRYAPHEMQYFTFGNTQPVINQDYNFYISKIVNECANTKWEGFSIPANSNPIDYPELFTPSQSMDLALKLIYSPNFPQKEIYEIKDILFMIGYDSTIQPSNIIELYEEVLLDYYESSSGIYIGYREILNQLIEQASFWANNNIIKVRQSDTMTESAEFSQICNLIDNIITESKLDINHFMHGREFELEAKKTEIMRLSRNYDNALNYISTLRNNYTGYYENFTLDNLECINNLENDLALGNIAPHQILEQYTCLQNNFLDTFYAELNEVTGVVYNSETFAPIEGASISFSSDLPIQNITTLSKEGGSYSISFKSDYDITIFVNASADGFYNYKDTFELTSGYDLTYDLYLTPTASMESIYDDKSSSAGEQIEPEKTLKIYPNPSSSETILEWEGYSLESQIEVFDLHGRAIYHTNWKGDSALKINTSEWKSGVYFVNIYTAEGNKLNRKIVIAR